MLFLGGPPVAPVFIVIFGYFIAESKKSTIQLIIRGLKIIFLGLFLNIALNLNLIISVSQGKFNIDIWPYIFGIDILPLAGLSLIIIAMLSFFWRINKSFILIPLIILILISAFLGNFLLNYSTAQPLLKYALSPFYGVSTWSYFPLFPWLSYSLTGIAFYKIKQNYNFNILYTLKTKIIFGVLFILFLTFTIQYGISISSSVSLESGQKYYHHDLVFFLWVIVFLSLYSYFTNEIDKIIGSTILLKYIKWLGKNITVLYIIQWIIIGNTATEIYKTISSPFYLCTSFLVVLVASSLFCYLWTKLKVKFIKPA